MNGLQSVAVKDLFERGIDYWENHQRNFTVTVSMYEIYGGKLYDLLNDHAQLSLREDKSNTIQIAGLKEQFVDNDDQILELINQGNQMRTTHATKANDSSSRSHAIT
jgi:kinesin family member 2/24